ncbi:MAG: hypothetical protein QOI46_5029 [Alphaproteobacteria bacterium]|nr:hypothetical protein [Alphaproteobacteria bacterium]
MVSKSRIARVLVNRSLSLPVAGGRGRALALCAVLAIGLGGCSSTLSSLPTQLGGMPADTPQPSAAPVAYPAVHDMPPPRGSTVLTDAEQKKLEDDLIAARTRTGEAAKPVGRPD